MAIYRIKRFSAQDPSMYGQQNNSNQLPIPPKPLTSKDLQMENMRLQREIIRNSRAEQKLRAEERKQLLQAQKDAQRQEMKNNREEDKNQLKAEAQSRTENPGAKHPSLYKKNTTAIKPISMK